MEELLKQLGITDDKVEAATAAIKAVSRRGITCQKDALTK